MNNKIFNISLNDNIIKYTVKHILTIYDNKDNVFDFSDVAVIMPSKRPGLFIKKELSKFIGKSFIPPKFFTIDELVKGIDEKCINRKFLSIIDSVYVIYNIVKEKIKSDEFSDLSFSEFFEWGKEILNFINCLDVEKIDNSKLLNLKIKADIGYDFPQNINDLLKNLHDIRKEFHSKLNLLKKTTGGYSYYNASSNISEYLKKYKKVILSNVYYLNKSEVDMFKVLYDENKLDIIVKGNFENWKGLKKIYDDFNLPVISKVNETLNDNIDIYSAYDGQSQACLVKNLISKIPLKDRYNSVVIVPDNAILQSVMTELYSIEKDINVAAGYPANRTTVFSLIKSIIQTIKNKNKDKYYVKDIVSVISNPLVKNMRFIGKPEVTRIIVHEIVKNFDRFSSSALFGGYQFISLNEIINNRTLCENISKKISTYWKEVSHTRIKKIITEIFDLFIGNFSCSVTMKTFGENIKNISDNIVEKSLINKYSFNIGAINILFDISGQFCNSICSNEICETREIINILENILNKANINLVGNPLKGIQVLGLMEARGLSFDNVFVLSMTDSIVPNISEINSLIPKEIITGLGVGYNGRDVDIQKYHFMSLISGAKKVSLIYPKDNNSIKSRFIEELIWKKQLKEQNLQVANVIDTFIPNLNITQNKQEYFKTDKIKQYLLNFDYSATSINTYMQCKLKFYYHYVLKLKEQTDYDTEYGYIDIGNCIHDFVKDVFHKDFLHDTLYDMSFKKVYEEKLENIMNIYFKYDNTGKNFLLRKLIKNKMERLYEKEINRNFRKILASEFDINSKIKVDNNSYKLVARIDRIDENIDGSITIIDYKTGNIDSPLSGKFIDDSSFTRKIIAKNIKSFQLIMYKYLYEKQFCRAIDNCLLYSMKTFDMVNLFKEKDDKNKIYDSSLRQLKYIISEINSDEPFKSESYDEVNCEKCPYFYLCR